MIKKFTFIFSSIIILLILILIYLNFYGIETNRFNSLIRDEIKSYDNKLDIKLKKVKLLLDLKNFAVKIQTINPTITYQNIRVDIKKISTNFSLESYFKKKFGVKNLFISTKSTNIKDLIYIARSVKNSPELFIISQTIKKGTVQATIDLRFDDTGKVKSDYIISGITKNIELKLPKNHHIDNINFNFNILYNNYKFKNISFDYNKIKFFSESIFFNNKENNYLIEGNIKNNEAILNSKLISLFLNNNLNNLEINNTKAKTESDFNLVLSKKYKIKDYNVKSKITLSEIKYKLKSKLLKKYIKDYKDIINFQNSILNINYSKNNLIIGGSSNYLINDLKNKLDFKFKKRKEIYNFDFNIGLDKNEISIDELNYKKQKNKKANLTASGIYQKNKNLLFEKINFTENKNIASIKGLKININESYKISEFKNINVKYSNTIGIKNDIIIKNKGHNYFVTGRVFDITKLINDIVESDTKSNFIKNFDNLNSLIKIKIDKLFLDKNNFVNNLQGDIEINKNKITDLNLNSKYSKNEKLFVSIKTTNNKETITTLYSDRAAPFVKNYKFIKGFEDGVLDFQSIKKNNSSKSTLKIDNFKVKEVPVLAKLLTLASLQGIADLLTGEGIRFTDFEMIFLNKDNLMTIEEIYAIGPAISIMMNGYIEKKKLVSLRGTLVPATTINRTISSIPLIGDILIGKKVGEGVFGVSFKIKGPPKKLRTTVNPIKTLTPRFITRTLEKITK